MDNEKADKKTGMSSRTKRIIVIVAVGVVALLGVGTWAVVQTGGVSFSDASSQKDYPDNGEATEFEQLDPAIQKDYTEREAVLKQMQSTVPAVSQSVMFFLSPEDVGNTNVTPDMMGVLNQDTTLIFPTFEDALGAAKLGARYYLDQGFEWVKGGDRPAFYGRDGQFILSMARGDETVNINGQTVQRSDGTFMGKLELSTKSASTQFSGLPKLTGTEPFDGGGPCDVVTKDLITFTNASGAVEGVDCISDYTMVTRESEAPFTDYTPDVEALPSAPIS